METRARYALIGFFTLAVIVASVALSWRAVDGVDSLAYGAGRLTLVERADKVTRDACGRPRVAVQARAARACERLAALSEGDSDDEEMLTALSISAD